MAEVNANKVIDRLGKMLAEAQVNLAIAQEQVEALTADKGLKAEEER